MGKSGIVLGAFATRLVSALMLSSKSLATVPHLNVFLDLICKGVPYLAKQVANRRVLHPDVSCRGGDHEYRACAFTFKCSTLLD